MAELQDVLKLRVLLCFINNDPLACTVTGISKILREEKYTISRALTSMEKEGLVDRRDPRNPKLTEEGIKQGQEYAKRVEHVTEYLTHKGVDVISAKQDAIYWALYTSEATMEMLGELCSRQRIKQNMMQKERFTGSMLFKKLQDGEYSFSFIICRENALNGNLISMANAGFENPCKVTIKDGEATLHLRTKEVMAVSASSKKRLCAQACSLKYDDHGEFIAAEKRGNVFSFPAEVLEFINVGSTGEQMLHGSVRIRIECSAGNRHMPESTAVFTLLI